MGRKADEKGGGSFVDRKSLRLLRQAHRQQFYLLSITGSIVRSTQNCKLALQLLTCTIQARNAPDAMNTRVRAIGCSYGQCEPPPPQPRSSSADIRGSNWTFGGHGESCWLTRGPNLKGSSAQIPSRHVHGFANEALFRIWLASCHF
jgi:hypothetical protein